MEAPVAERQPRPCCDDPITSNLYDSQQASQIPEEALLASLGCGNPTALAKLNAGETVLDLGSGGGIDVLLSAKRVGPAGKAYGLDMTDEMLALANENKRKAGAENVEFLKGEIENIPLPDNSVDVVISNCVINLSSDKARVLREAYRVLKPGGRFAVSDVVTRGEILPEIRKSVLLWVGCVAGALDETDYRKKLESAVFRTWKSSRLEPIVRPMPGNSSPPLASTPMRSHRKSMGSSSALSCARPSQCRSKTVAASHPAVNNERNNKRCPTTFSFSARAIPRAPSWPKPF